MKECCANCRRRFNLRIWDYSHPPRPRKANDVAGFICMAFSEEGEAIWMRGTNEERDLCECFEPKEETE